MIRAQIARPEDLRAVVDITERAYAQWEPIVGGKPMPVTEDYAPRIARNQVWIIERDAVRLGVMVVERQPDHLLIFSFAVLPEAQGQGIGRWMLRHAETLAWHSSLPAVRLYTNAKMEWNIALYRNWGFSPLGERSLPDRPGWTVLDMEKTITRA